MPRKKARLTLKKKTKSKEETDKDGITLQAFAKFAHEYGSFEIEDINHVQHNFFKDETAYIKHQDPADRVAVPEEDYWIGTIREIRADHHDDVWVRVQWYWSPQEVAEVIKSFDPTVCGKYEKLFSDNYDIIPVRSFVKHVVVTRFDEKCIYQVPIDEDEWFFRYEFLYTAKRITPKVTHVACPICKVPYTPGRSGPGKILHFCPRPSCCNFYHQSCLVKNGYVIEPRTDRVPLETWPNVDRTISVEALCCMRPPKKRRKKVHSTAKESEHDPLASLPEQLVAVAGQQIVRATGGGGVVGNIAPVAAARQLIFRTLEKGGVIPDDWETSTGVSAAFPQSDTHPNCFCPSCYSAI